MSLNNKQFLTLEQRKKYEDYLEWLITPTNESEKKLFKEENLVDDYISIINSIPEKTDEQLLDSIDSQLKSFGQSLDRGNL